jgi:hypothetical protein
MMARYSIGAMIAVAVFAAFAMPAYAQTSNAERDCQIFVDQLAARVRAGLTESAKADIPRLQQCQVILKAAVDREAGKTVSNGATPKAPSNPPK